MAWVDMVRAGIVDLAEEEKPAIFAFRIVRCREDD